MMRKPLASSVIAFAICFAPAAAKAPAPALQSFEFLGCSGGWDGELQEPEIWRVVAGGTVTFLTHSVATCGLTGSDPVVSGDSNLLNLEYTLHALSDGVAMCDCEYWAKFTFGSGADSVKAVTFNGEGAALRGEWPED